MPRVALVDLGLQSFAKTLEFQKQLVALKNPWVGKLLSDVLILVEHFPTFTAGKRIKNWANPSKLQETGAETFMLGRGGQTTFHGPGQLVAYPILNLCNFKRDLHWYVHSLEQVLIDTCAFVNVPTERCEHVGVWTSNKKKIGAVGIQLDRWVSWHGVSLNCNTDLKWFDYIEPCGLNLPVTSLSKETQTDMSVERIKTVFKKSFSKIFAAEFFIDDEIFKIRDSLLKLDV